MVGQDQAAMAVIWHDLECGAYVEDLAVWRELATEHGDPVLDVGAGTGRVTVDLARRASRSRCRGSTTSTTRWAPRR